MKLKNIFVIAAILTLSACADAPPEREGHEVAEVPPTAPLAATDPVPAPATAAAPAVDDPRIAQMQARIDALQKQLEDSQNALALARKGVPQGVIPSAADLRGVNPIVAPVAGDPERGFVQDDAVQLYRKALILYQAGKYADSVLEFSGFLERFPDHALAGSAQFYVGDSYFRQKEYKLAHQEYTRVLTSYDRSAHVAHALRQLAEVEDIMKKHEDAARHRQLLTSLFPQSPAAVVKVTAAQALRQAPADSVSPPASEVHSAIEPQPLNAGEAAKAAALDEPPPPTAPLGSKPQDFPDTTAEAPNAQ